MYNNENGTYNMGLFIKESERQEHLKQGAPWYTHAPSSHLAVAVSTTRIGLTGIFAHPPNLKQPPSS
jgi:hypothetical protein